MAQITLSRTEVIPFLDSSGQVMQMKQYEIAVSVTSESGDTEESIKALLDSLYEEQRQIVGSQIPLLKSKDKRLRVLQDELKKKTTTEEYSKIILALKQI